MTKHWVGSVHLIYDPAGSIRFTNVDPLIPVTRHLIRAVPPAPVGRVRLMLLILGMLWELLTGND